MPQGSSFYKLCPTSEYFLLFLVPCHKNLLLTLSIFLMTYFEALYMANKYKGMAVNTLFKSINLPPRDNVLLFHIASFFSIFINHFLPLYKTKLFPM